MGRQTTAYSVGDIVEEPVYTTVIEYDANSNPVYVGLAGPGTLTSETGWQIKKITFDASNNPTNVQYPSGRADFAFIWTQRSTYTYS